jgi:hypothetical protein
LQRTTATFNINHDFFRGSLKIDLTLKGSYTNSHFAAGAIGSAIAYDPTQAVYDSKSPYGGYTEWTDSNNKPNTHLRHATRLV